MKTLKELFQVARMYYMPLTPNNSVEGLFEMIKDIVKPNFFMAEIGSFSGVSSELFARFVNYIYCIDIWNSDPNYIEIDAEKINQSFVNFTEMAKSYNNIGMVKKTSLKAVEGFNNESLDLVYIDGRHDYESVLSDIKAWLPKVKKGGWITGHDIDLKFSEKEGKRVFEAVTEMFGNDYKTYPDTSWAHQIN